METNTPVKGRPRGMFAAAAKNREEEIQEAHPLRPAMREDDSVLRARQRAAELREHLEGEIVDGTDEFYIDPSVIPDGWHYEWKRNTIYGAEDPSYQVALARSGWTAVPTSRHPAMMPHAANSAVITRKGQVLMEIPKEIYSERKAAEYNKARQQVRHKEAQLSGTPDGTLERTRPEIRKSYSQMPIPKE